jgi:hypothetical protein
MKKEWKPDSWNKSSDGSAMKVSESYGVIKTERISSDTKPHSHEIVKVDHMTGRVKEISIGSERPKKAHQAIVQ